MEIKVCKNCRRLFKYLFGPELCQDCSKLLEHEKLNLSEQSTYCDQIMPQAHEVQMEQGNLNSLKSTKKVIVGSSIKAAIKDELTKFEQVKDYIMANPRATVAEISEIYDIPPTKLFEWIKDDRLEFSDDSEYAWFHCEQCGIKIKSGRLCNRCKIK